MRNRIMAALAAATLSFAAPAFAAAPDTGDLEPTVPVSEYQLETVLIVHGWILCVSQLGAESIARAREESPEAQARVYDELAAAKACGRVKKLGVILQAPLYRTGPGYDYEARVFGALVNIGVGWQSGFVVGGLPE